MLIKLAVTVVIIYAIFKFSSISLLSGADESGKEEPGDYIDYEEVQDDKDE